MNIYKMAVDTLAKDSPPKNYREMAELWIKLNPEKHIPAFQMCVQAARISEQSDAGYYKPKTRRKAMETPFRVGFKAPASLLRFIQYADPDVLTDDKKYQQLKKQLPMLDCKPKFIY